MKRLRLEYDVDPMMGEAGIPLRIANCEDAALKIAAATGHDVDDVVMMLLTAAACMFLKHTQVSPAVTEETAAFALDMAFKAARGFFPYAGGKTS